MLERGAVEGEVFHRGAVQALAPDEAQVTPRLAALVRKELIRPDRPQLAGEDGFRFRHVLIRDAAYDALPKAIRAELHQRLAGWMEARSADLVELDEVLGYHLEQACRYRAEIGTLDDGTLAALAQGRLAAAGRRALLRADYGAAVSLLERAAALAPPTEIDVALEVDLADALFWSGKGGDAQRRARCLVEQASAAGDRVAELCGKIKEAELRVHLEPEGAIEKLAAIANQAMPMFEAVSDDVALCIGYSALGEVSHLRAQTDTMLEAYETALAHAQRAGLPQQFLQWRASARLWGTTPVSALLSWLGEQERQGLRGPLLHEYRAPALAMLGRFDEARASLAEAHEQLADRGGGIQLGILMGIFSVDIERLAGDPAAAVALGEEGCRLLGELGDEGFLSTAAGGLAQALYALDRLEEADAWADRAAELGASDDAITQMLWRQVRAKVLARRGEDDEAERLAREVVAIGKRTDMLNSQADTYADLGEVLLLVRKPGEAAAAFEQALDRYERKGNIVSTHRAQSRLAEIRAVAPR